MDLKDVMVIGGKPGLYKVIGRKPNGYIVESIDDKKTRMTIGVGNHGSSLSEITIFSQTSEDIFLKDVLAKIKELNVSSEEAPKEILTAKSDPSSLRKFFSEVAPGFDERRVYNSDIIKIMKWHEILLKYTQE